MGKREQHPRLVKVRELYGPWGAKQPNDERDYWATLNHLADYITDYYGHRCPAIGGGCACCQAWAVYDLARAVWMEPE